MINTKGLILDNMVFTFNAILFSDEGFLQDNLALLYKRRGGATKLVSGIPTPL